MHALIRGGGGKLLLAGLAAVFLFALGPILLAMTPLFLLGGIEMVFSRPNFGSGRVEIGAWAWRRQVEEIASQYQVDPDVALAILAVESQGNPDVERDGRIGLMGLTAELAKILGINPYDALDNIRGGVMYLRHLYQIYEVPEEAWAAYRYGVDRVPPGRGIPAFARDYVDAVKTFKTLVSLYRMAEMRPAPREAGGEYGLYPGYRPPKTTFDYYISNVENCPRSDISPLLPPLKGWQNPVPGFPMTSPYGWRKRPVGGGYGCHHGVDIGAYSGTSVRPAANGLVSVVAWNANYGNVLVIDHGNGVYTFYAHLDRVVVRPGEEVTTDQIVAYTGNTGRLTTGPHLHLEVHIYDPALGILYSYDPLDYIGYIPLAE